MAYDVKEAQEAFNEAKTAWSENYEAAQNDIKFAHGEGQWDEADVASRREMNRPSLVINLIPQFIHQVVNDIRVKQPSINVTPVGSGADVETAKIYQGLIRNIEYTSGAAEAYVTALDLAVRGGIGFIRVDHDYETLDSFNQQLYIKKVVNPFSHYLDPNSVESDGCDAMYGFALDAFSEKDFNKKYPGFDPVSFTSGKNQKRDKKDPIEVAEHFYIKEESRQIALLNDGTMVEYVEGLENVKTVRTVKKRIVKRCKLSGSDVLEETTFPGSYIPIIPVYGEELWIEGKRKLKSLTHDMKDSQRMHNYWASLETQILMMQPIAPVMAAVGQTEDYADEWQNPGKSMVLRYKTTDAQGNQIPPPQRLSPPSIPTGIINARQSSAEDMKAAVGMYNDTIGQRSNAVSGVAINNRKIEGEIATLHFGDNLNRSIAHVGRVIVSAVPEIYDTSRVIRIIGEEDASEEVGVNGQFVEGQKRAFDLTTGQYDVRVTTGSSFTTKRQEAVQYLQTLIQSQPELVNVAGDILVKNMDFPGAEALAERLRKAVPPNLLSDKERKEAEEKGLQQADPEKLQMQQVIQQGMQELQTLQEQNAQLQEALKSKRSIEAANIQIDAAKLELEKEKIANDRMKIEIEAQKAQVDAQLREAELALQAQQAQMQQQMQCEMDDKEEEDKPKQQPQVSIVMSRDGLAPHFDAMDAIEQQRKAEDEAKELALEQAKMDQQAALAQAIVQAVNNLTMAVNTPKQVVRGDDGRVVGVQ